MYASFCGILQYDNVDRSPPDGFTILYKPYSDDEDESGYQTHKVPGAKSRRAVIFGLLSGTSYSFRMRSFNAAGSGELSNAVVKQTLGR
jgi:Fibronectin type III domain